MLDNYLVIVAGFILVVMMIVAVCVDVANGRFK